MSNGDGQQQPQVKLSKEAVRFSPVMKCEQCENINWIKIYQVRVISKFYSPIGHEFPFPVHAGYICANCGRLAGSGDPDPEESNQ